MPVIFALDTATPFLTLALRWDGGELESSSEVGRAHAELLPEKAQALFALAGLPFRADRVVIGTGPGSYTGVRVGASYALGLARVWQAPVVGVCTLESLVTGDGRQAVSLDARKGNVYAAIYDVQGGVVINTLEAAAKRPLQEFEAGLLEVPHHQSPVPSGRALLEAGAAHGQAHWQLSYL